MSTRTISSPPDNREQLDGATALLAQLSAGGVTARALGGVAVAMRCEHARTPGPLARTWSDLDLMIDRASTAVIGGAMEAAGYEGERRFNALHGHARMMFARPDGAHVDVFVEEFAMCHKLSLGPRLHVHDATVPLADLLLTKLQVAELNAKDVTDAAALLLDHELTDDERGINVAYIGELVGQDWGWWRTVDENVRKLGSLIVGLPLDPDRAAHLRAQMDELLGCMERAPKSMRWRIRARAGDRLPWRDEPEESH